MSYNASIDDEHNGKMSTYIPAAAIQPRVTGGCADLANYETTTGRPDISHLAFDGSTDEFAQFSIAMPNRYDGGNIEFQVYWTGLVAGAGTVDWALQAIAIGNDETMDVVFDSADKAIDTFLVAEDLHVRGPVTYAFDTVPVDNDLVVFEIWRDADTDSRTADANLIGLKLIIGANAMNDD